MKKIIIILALFVCFGAQAQIGVGIPNPNETAVLELNSNKSGFLPPRLTTAERDAIAQPALGLTIFNTSKNCLEWYVGTAWFNGCGDNGVAIADSYICNVNSVGGMTAGVPVSGVSQTITVIVLVAGSYNISASANGVTFSAIGNFTSAGSHDVILNAVGTPVNPGDHEFTLNTSPNTCSFTRAVGAGVGVVSNIVCNTASAGEMNLGVPVIGVTQTITAMVTTIGSYNLRAAANGVIFSAQGSYLSTGPQQVVLRATGTPAALGSFDFAIEGTPTCTFSRNTVVGQAVVSNFACGAGTGVLNMGVPLVPGAVTQNVTATVTRIGSYNITTSVNGVTFAATGTFTAVGANNVILTATGTPLAVGFHDFILNGTPSCSFNRQTVLGVGIVSGFTCDTGSTGTMLAGTPVSGVTQTITATVTAVGSYNIRVATVNGITFAATGTYTASGPQQVVLTATGTPIAGGTHSFVISGTPTCTFTRVISAVSTVVGAAGRIWAAYNEGATAPSTSLTNNMGDLYQQGRRKDGHQIRTSPTTAAGTNNNPFPDHNMFYLSAGNWVNGGSDVLWTGIGAANNPCEAGFRVPSLAEWEAEFTAARIAHAGDGLNGALKLPYTGIRSGGFGIISTNIGGYWSSTASGVSTSAKELTNSKARTVAYARANGLAVRCIKN